VSPRRGPDLPYSIVAGVAPCDTGWLVASAKMAAATFAPEIPRIFLSFAEIISERPPFAVIVVNAPIGYAERLGIGPRTCDLEVREILGLREPTLHSTSTHVRPEEIVADSDERLYAIPSKMLPLYREVAAQISTSSQRIVHEGHPELSFYQLNGSMPLRWSRDEEPGQQERRALLEQKVPGVDRIIDAELEQVPQKHLMDCAALLWTARRVLGHAANRIPTTPEWDSEGLRVEMVM